MQLTGGGEIVLMGEVRAVSVRGTCTDPAERLSLVAAASLEPPCPPPRLASPGDEPPVPG